MEAVASHPTILPPPCEKCGGPTWTLDVLTYIGPVGSSLYHYANLLRPDRLVRWHEPNVWCCDSCQIAGLIK